MTHELSSTGLRRRANGKARAKPERQRGNNIRESRGRVCEENRAKQETARDAVSGEILTQSAVWFTREYVIPGKSFKLSERPPASFQRLLPNPKQSARRRPKDMDMESRRMRPFSLEKRWNLSAIATSFTLNTKTSRLKLANEAENIKNGPAADGAVSLNGSLRP